jgi:hypothetical protein
MEILLYILIFCLPCIVLIYILNNTDKCTNFVVYTLHKRPTHVSVTSDYLLGLNNTDIYFTTLHLFIPLHC